MSRMIHFSLTAFAAAMLVYAAGLASAQAQVKQIKLTEKQVEGFIAAYKEMSEASRKLPDEAPDAELDARLSPIARKLGFKDLEEYQEVVGNIALVMLGLDANAKVFIDPPTRTRQLLEQAKVDKFLTDEERKQVVEDLTEQLKLVQPIMHPGNIELVKKYFDRLAPLVK